MYGLMDQDGACNNNVISRKSVSCLLAFGIWRRSGQAYGHEEVEVWKSNLTIIA
jgi:hypothetical protein